MSENNKLTLAHVTHEAVEQIGGIGTVLEGLITSPVYQQHVQRSILVGPTATHMSVDPETRLGDHGKVLYSSIDNIDRAGLGSRLRPIEYAFDVKLVYGTREYDPPGQDRHGEAEVLLIDVFHVNDDRLNVLKYRLHEHFGIDSSKYEGDWGYEEYLRLAEPAFYALSALMKEEDLPCVLFAHEFMGLPAALKAILDGQREFRTVFHAHECSTARGVVENHAGHDTMFYNVLARARDNGQYVEDIFGSLEHAPRHALVSRSHLCDGIIAVGDYTAAEMKFLNEHFDDEPVDVVYNGLPAINVDLDSKTQSRNLLAEYSKALLGHTPDVLMTHVTRPVVSKGMWRDLKVCHELDQLFALKNKTGVLYILTSAGGVRRPQDIVSMEKHYGWPRHHREGYPDLVGPESALNTDIENFNQSHSQIQVVLVNQFGWSRQRIGQRIPDDMNMADLRRAADVEFGMATYEPFGISPLEPLGCGAICLISNICGCAGFLQQATGSVECPNAIIADFTQLDREYSMEELTNMSSQDRDRIEEGVSKSVAEGIMKRLPWTDADRSALIESGQSLVDKMGWDQVVGNALMPMLERIVAEPVPA